FHALRGNHLCFLSVFFFQAEDGIRDKLVTGVQTCALPISGRTRPGTTATSRPHALDEKTSVYCTKPTFGAGVLPSGDSLIIPNCASYRARFSPSARQMRFACPGLTIILFSSFPCAPFGKI